MCTRMWVFIFAIAAISCVLFLPLWTLTVGAANGPPRTPRTAPRTLEELDLFYPTVSPKENGARVYLDGFKRIDYRASDELPYIDGRFTPEVPVQPIPTELKSKITNFLISNGPALALLHKGASFKRCRYPIHLKACINVNIPHIPQLREGGLLLALQALNAAENHDSDTAVRALKDGLALADSLCDEPLLVSQLLRIDLCEVIVQALEQALNRHTFDEEHLVKLQSAFTAVDKQEPVARAFEGEKCLLQNLPPVDLRGLPNRTDSKAIRRLDRLIEAARKPLPEFANEVFAIVGDLRIPGACITKEPAQPAVPRLAHASIRLSAQLRVAVTALAVERYRAANKRLPQTLADLVPTFLKELPIDPYDAVPERYRKTEKGYRVYSVYHNRKDDNGEKGNTKPELDFVLAVER